MANVSQLQPSLIPQVQTSSNEASEKDADFLALRLLNKRARLRLSPVPLELSSIPGKASLFAIANSKGWFAAVTRDAGGASVLILSPLVDLRSALTATSAEEEQTYKPQRRVPISGELPYILTFACNDTRILLGMVHGSIHVYSSNQLLSSGESPVQPIHTFPTSPSTAILSIQPNPGDIPELVAVLRDCVNSPGSLAVELLDVQKLVSSGGWMTGGSPSTTPTSISWSPKGKQLALGLQSGDIVTFSPSATATPKSSVPHPPATDGMSVISVHWLSTSSFHTIYAQPGQLTPEVEQIHFHTSLDSKSNSAQDIKFNSPYLPFPGLRLPGEFLVCLRGWDPSKVLLFIGDSTSSDIGLIGSVTDDSGERWHNLDLEETSTPSLPLDNDQNDTILLGMDVDLTSTESYHHSTASGEALELPAHPIMYVYASDGTILGWHVLNITGAPYPGMITALNVSTPALTVPSVPSSIVRELSSDMQTTPTISPITSAPAEVTAINPPSAVFGQPTTFGAQGSAFGQPSVFAQTQSGFSQQSTSGFGKAPFGQSATFGGTSTSSPFTQSSTPAFSSAAPSVGFGAFSSTGPAKFGQSTFSFGGPPQATLTQAPSTSVPDENMAADDAPSLDGLGLGVSNSQDDDSNPSIFGKPSVPVSSSQRSTDGSLIQPAAGFGAFSAFDQKSPFAKPSVFSSTQQPTTTFGFGAFSSGTQSAFAVAALKNDPSTKPVWAMDGSSKPAESSPLGGTTNVFGKPTESETKTPLVFPSKTADTSTTPSSFATTSAFSMASQFVGRDSNAGDDDSRSPSPAPAPPKVTTSPVFSSSSPGPSTGAFSNLQTTPFAFVKPASGAFAEPPKDSPFFAPRQPESKPATVFALSMTQDTPTSMPPKVSPAQPTFGASSMPSGTLRSAFPPVSTTPAEPPPVSSSSAFNAFASGAGGFAAFSSGGNRSFTDLLRSKDEDKSQNAEATPTKPAQQPVSTTPASTPVREPPRPPSAPQTEEEKPKTVEVKATETPVELKERAAEPFLESISSSTTSSFVKVSAEEDEVAKGEISDVESQGDAESLSSEAPSESEESEEEEEEEESEVLEEGCEVHEEEEASEEGEGVSFEAADKEETEEQAQKESEPTAIPLPMTPASTRSPSTTPKAEHPKVTVSVSPPPQSPSPASVPRVSPVRDLGTTPPGSPVRDVPPVPVQMPVPTLKASPPPTSLFGLAPRPNNRPMRSSPLANSSLVLESEVETPPVSKSAPPAMVAQPAAPKEPFGQWIPPPPPAVQPAASIFAPATTAPVQSVFIPPGKVTTTISGPSGSVFILPTSFPSFKLSTPTPSTWGAPIFTPPLPKTPMPAPALAPTPTPPPEQGMQAECLLLLSTLERELENLKRLATAASMETGELKKTSSVAHQKADLGDPLKWVFGDIEEYGRVLLDIQADVKELKLQRVSLRKAMKELDSNMLKINTRKEEIVRFNRAKTDAEFAKMLKIRTLAPEYSETQSQLRRNIRAIRDRVQKLEDHLQASKKRINEFKTCKPSIRPPSLDTVNRTFRNIDIVIDQQKQEISQLRHRMAKLEISGGIVGTRDQLTVSSSKRPLNVTSNVAVTTAAALNAERSAQKLKKAMLASRTQPLLNTTAIASPVMTSFQTPQKAAIKTDVKTPDVKTTEGVFISPTTSTMSFPSSLPSWTPPPLSEFGSPVSYDITPTRNRGGVKHHQKSVVLKKNPSPAGPTQPSLFEWKPVEFIKPASSLPFSLRSAGSS